MKPNPNADRSIMKWTLVQHSAFGYAGNRQFERAVQIETLTKASEVRAVQAAGGLLFDDYGKASEREFAENYPPEFDKDKPCVPPRLTPMAQGRFSRRTVANLAIYLPPQTTNTKTT